MNLFINLYNPILSLYKCIYTYKQLILYLYILLMESHTHKLVRE